MVHFGFCLNNLNSNQADEPIKLSGVDNCEDMRGPSIVSGSGKNLKCTCIIKL